MIFLIRANASKATLVPEGAAYSMCSFSNILQSFAPAKISSCYRLAKSSYFLMNGDTVRRPSFDFFPAPMSEGSTFLPFSCEKSLFFNAFLPRKSDFYEKRSSQEAVT